MITPMRVAAGLVSVGDCEASGAHRGRIEGLRETEIEHFHRAVSAQLDVCRLQIAVHDAVIVGRFERFCDLASDRPRVLQRKRAMHEPVGQRHALDELENERRRAVRFLEPVNRGDVGMVE